MEKDVEAYFIEKYKDSKIKVVPGHWPDFKSREEIDKWTSILEKTMETFLNHPEVE